MMNPKSSQTGFGLYLQEKFPNDINIIFLKTQLIELIYCDLLFKAISHSNFGKRFREDNANNSFI